MKRTLLVSLFFLSITGYSQIKYNFSVGTNFTSFNNDIMEELGFEEYRQDYIDAGGSATSSAKNAFRMGFVLSAEMEIKLNEKSYFLTGMKYSTTGDSYNFSTDDVVLRNGNGSESDERIKMRPRLDYISIPINYGRAIHKRISIYGGFTPSINIKNDLRFNYYEGDNDDLKQKWDSFENPIEASQILLFANLGGKYILIDGKSPQLYTTLNFNYSLNNVYSDSIIEGTEIEATKLWSLEVTLGLTILK